MAYGHAERTLATIRQLEMETRELLLGLDRLDQEQAAWLADIAHAGSQCLTLANPRQAGLEAGDHGRRY
jgi:hypothetical protein